MKLWMEATKTVLLLGQIYQSSLSGDTVIHTCTHALLKREATAQYYLPDNKWVHQIGRKCFRQNSVIDSLIQVR